MKRTLSLFALAALPVLALAGCLSDDNASSDGGVAGEDGSTTLFDATTDHAGPSTGDAGTDATLDSNASDAAIDAFDAAYSDAGTATVRLANMVPDFASAIDVCVTGESGKFLGPVLLAGGVAGGLAYGEMTDYVPVPLGTKATIRVVAAGSVNCATPIMPDTSGLAGTDGEKATVVVMGSTANGSAHPPALQAFTDETLALPTQGVRVRFIHAAPASPATDFVIGAGPTFFEPLQTGMTYGHTIAAAQDGGTFTQDTSGYVTVQANESQITATRGGTDLTSFISFDVANLTAFFTGIEGSATTPPALVRCEESAAIVNHKVKCALNTAPPTFTAMRLAHMSPGIGTVNLCMKVEYGTTTHGPLVAQSGVAAGISYLHMTGPLASVPTWTSFGVFYVAGGQPCSATATVATPMSFEGNADTIALAQSFPSTDGGAGFLGYGSDTAFTGQPAPDGGAAINVADWDFDDPYLSDGGNNIDMIATPDVGASTTLVQNVPPLSSGFAETLAPGTYSIQVTITGGGPTLYSKGGITFNAGDRSTLWAFHDTINHMQVLKCNLAPPDAGTLTTCSD